MVQAERVRLWSLEKVDDFAILARALRYADLIHRRLARRRVAGGCYRAAGARRRSCRRPLCRKRLRLDHERGLRRISVDEADSEASVCFLDHLRRDVARDELVATRQHYRVTRDTERTVEDDGVAFAAIALRVLVRFEDSDAALAAAGHGSRE